MDTLDIEAQQRQQAADVEKKLALIKTEMPMTYAAIQAWSKRVGRVAFSQVRRGLMGEWFCFFAHESGNMMGQPWASLDHAEDAVWLTHFGSITVHVQLGMGEPT